MDKFSLGSIIIAVFLEVTLIIGWANSPQEEPVHYVLVASLLPALLIGVTLLFHYLQREA